MYILFTSFSHRGEMACLQQKVLADLRNFSHNTFKTSNKPSGTSYSNCQSDMKILGPVSGY